MTRTSWPARRWPDESTRTTLSKPPTTPGARTWMIASGAEFSSLAATLALNEAKDVPPAAGVAVADCWVIASFIQDAGCEDRGALRVGTGGHVFRPTSTNASIDGEGFGSPTVCRTTQLYATPSPPTMRSSRCSGNTETAYMVERR